MSEGGGRMTADRIEDEQTERESRLKRYSERRLAEIRNGRSLDRGTFVPIEEVRRIADEHEQSKETGAL
jgi:hypothetical protein